MNALCFDSAITLRALGDSTEGSRENSAEKRRLPNTDVVKHDTVGGAGELAYRDLRESSLESIAKVIQHLAIVFADAGNLIEAEKLMEQCIELRCARVTKNSY